VIEGGGDFPRKPRENRTLTVKAGHPSVAAIALLSAIVRTAETVAGAADVPVVADATVDAEGAADVLVAAAAIEVDAAVPAAEGTNFFAPDSRGLD
jgi:hypothetical protein